MQVQFFLVKCFHRWYVLPIASHQEAPESPVFLCTTARLVSGFSCGQPGPPITKLPSRLIECFQQLVTDGHCLDALFHQELIYLFHHSSCVHELEFRKEILLLSSTIRRLQGEGYARKTGRLTFPNELVSQPPQKVANELVLKNIIMNL